MDIQAREYGIGRPILQMSGIMHGVMGPLLQHYYKQCYLSYKISYEIVLNVLLWQVYFNPHNIFCINHPCKAIT